MLHDEVEEDFGILGLAGHILLRALHTSPVERPLSGTGNEQDNVEWPFFLIIFIQFCFK